MTVTARKLTDDSVLRSACESTLPPGKVSRIRVDQLLLAEHSPIRTMLYWVDLIGVPTFVSVHLVRHKIGVEHFVKSNRDDRGGDTEVNRLTPVNHGMMINAQALLNISRKRLCYASHRTTVAWWMRVKRAIAAVDPVVASFMAPECVVRGYCPEPRECKPGCRKVLGAYWDSEHVKRREKLDAAMGL